MTTIQTVTGPCRPADLGLTLMHEHLIIGWPGWDSDTAAAAFDRREAKKMCVDRMHELKALGVTTLLDPCPIDLGRDVEFAAEVGGIKFAVDPSGGTVVAARTADRLFVEAANVLAPDFRRDVVEVGGQLQQLFAHEPVGVDTTQHSFGKVGRLGHKRPVPA